MVIADRGQMKSVTELPNVGLILFGFYNVSYVI